MKCNLYKPIEEEVIKRAGSIDGRRNAIGYINANDLERFCSSFIAACNEKGIKAESHYAWLGHRKSHRITFSPSNLTKEINQLSNKDNVAVGLYFEHPLVSKDNQLVEDEERYSVWIYHTINKKALTYFRKFLFGNIIGYEITE